MSESSQDPVAEIERALAQLQHARRPGARRPFGPGAGFGPGGGMPKHGQRGPHGPHAGRIGAARIRLLTALRDSEGLSVSAVAELIGVDQPRASRLVNDAAEHGLVERHPDPRDARRIEVRITAAGRTFLQSVEARRRSTVAAALAEFTPDETAAFAGLLSRFAAAFGR